jgi:ABC-type xylose transport system permease subunit
MLFAYEFNSEGIAQYVITARAVFGQFVENFKRNPHFARRIFAIGGVCDSGNWPSGVLRTSGRVIPRTERARRPCVFLQFSSKI